MPVDEHAAVAGLEDVYAVGDATSFPIKQGGLATQQADAAAAAIAAAAGAPVTPEPFTPVMRGLLLTGITSAYLRVELDAPERSSRLDWDSLWWPATKVAGRYLAPYLAGAAGMWVTPPAPARGLQSGPPGAGRLPAPLTARPTPGRRPDQTRALALEFAERDLALGDRRSAMHWAQTVEWLDGERAPEVERLFRRCERDEPAAHPLSRSAGAARHRSVATRARSRRRGRRRPPGRRAGARPGRLSPSCQLSSITVSAQSWPDDDRRDERDPRRQHGGAVGILVRARAGARAGRSGCAGRGSPLPRSPG